MRLDRFDIQMLLLALLILSATVGLLWLASYLAKSYCAAAGVMAVILPLCAVTGYLIYVLSDNRGDDNNKTEGA